MLPILWVCFGLILFFYTGGFLDWSAFPGIVTCFYEWVATGTSKEGGHVKEWYYWLELLCDYEWPALAGLAASVWLILAERERSLRWLILSGWAAFFAYSVVRYKTPWCLISIAWPFLFTFGVLLDRLCARGRLAFIAACVLATAAYGHSAYRGVRLNFYDYTEEAEPYVYVQTLPAIEKILGPLRRHVARNPANRHLRGYILFPPGAAHPLPWLLADYPQIELLDENQAPPQIDADFLLIDDAYVSDVEERLTQTYFRQTVIIRGNSGESAQLYLRASTFGYQFPGRTPEFTPPPREAVPAKTPAQPPSEPHEP